jgi:hypothetical protein
MTLCLLLAGCLTDGAPLPSLFQAQIEEMQTKIGHHYFAGPPVRFCKNYALGSDCEFKQGGFTVTGVKVADRMPPPFFQVKLDTGEEEFIDSLYSGGFLSEDPVVAKARADAECKRRGQPHVGMSLAQVRATCWGEPNHVNRTEGAGGVHDQLVYGSDRYVYMTNGIVTSIQSSARLR